MSPLSILIADDELLARKRLSRLLSAIPDVEVVGECEDGRGVLKALEEKPVDVVLLDIQMGDLSGVETMGLMRPDDPVIIFCTAYSEYAVDAFDGGAADYLLKPVEAARLKKALDRARKRLGSRRPSIKTSEEEDTTPDRIAIPTRKGLVLLEHSEVCYALIDGESVIIRTTRGEFITDFRITDLSRKLPSKRFERVHRRALINLDHITELEPLDSGGYLAHTTGGGEVPVSRQAARRLRKLWDLPRA